MADITPGRYRHYKGNEYTVLGVARHSETLEELVVYRQEYGDRGLWVRPAAMFAEIVEVDGQTVPRFAFLRREPQQRGRRTSPSRTGRFCASTRASVELLRRMGVSCNKCPASWRLHGGDVWQGTARTTAADAILPSHNAGRSQRVRGNVTRKDSVFVVYHEVSPCFALRGCSVQRFLCPVLAVRRLRSSTPFGR